MAVASASRQAASRLPSAQVSAPVSNLLPAGYWRFCFLRPQALGRVCRVRLSSPGPWIHQIARGLDILDFNPGHFHAPGVGSLINDMQQLFIDDISVYSSSSRSIEPTTVWILIMLRFISA